MKFSRRLHCIAQADRPAGSHGGRDDSRFLTLLADLVPVVFIAMTSLAGAVKAGAQQPAKPQNAPINVKFTDIRKAAGITFVQDSTETDEKYYLETMGTGVAWIDYDQDGLMDLYFVQAGATDAYKPAKPLHSALYHNNGDGTFTDVTAKAGVAWGEGSLRTGDGGWRF